jgi:hypothetical protein
MRDNIVLGITGDERRVNVLQVWMLSLMKSRALKWSVMMMQMRRWEDEKMLWWWRSEVGGEEEKEGKLGAKEEREEAGEAITRKPP